MMGDSLRTKTIRFDSVQPTSRYLINSLIFVKPVNDNVYVSISIVQYSTVQYSIVQYYYSV